ncbi:calcium/sodium antiporter [Aliigemmobacter aestuarii]|uniref:Calcium/sodium antiporter n=1 Tax=Aliigemmobacter aestuarii TaxID=1445661 RepID=A0A4S3MQF7_9RHOB|nr:calcium/sodium antiporter [Gemmobacter aestuarii]THD83611.1 calcium/sodium antiporter [Gemmobacter aestuarii]
MLLDLGYVVAGLILLVFGGDGLVKGAVALALRLGIPALIVGLTVVAFGTSAPELLVSVTAALDGAAGIAIGNVVGSNIANILLILGLPAIITTIHSSQIDTRRGYYTMLAVSLGFALLCFTGPLIWWHGLLLLAALAAMILDNIRSARAHKAANEDVELEGADENMQAWKVAAYILGGLVGLGVGANLLVTGAVNIARDFGISETVIGLTLVAIGTSLPELVTSIVAAIRKQADVALGNVIGSNIFNILSILGITALIAPLPVDPAILWRDNWVMMAVALALAPFVLFRLDITRLAGVGFVAAYVGYSAWLVL